MWLNCLSHNSQPFSLYFCCHTHPHVDKGLLLFWLYNGTPLSELIVATVLVTYLRNLTTVCLPGYICTYISDKFVFNTVLYILMVLYNPTPIHCYEYDWKFLAAIFKTLACPIAKLIFSSNLTLSQPWQFQTRSLYGGCDWSSRPATTNMWPFTVPHL